MPTSDIAIGLDIGTTKVCVVVAERDGRGQLNLLGKGHAESEGLQRATVVNVQRTVDSIRAAVADAEQESSITVGPVNVGISGTHVHCITSDAEISINQTGLVSESDVRRFLQKARAISVIWIWKTRSSMLFPNRSPLMIRRTFPIR